MSATPVVYGRAADHRSTWSMAERASDVGGVITTGLPGCGASAQSAGVVRCTAGTGKEATTLATSAASGAGQAWSMGENVSGAGALGASAPLSCTPRLRSSVP